MNVVVVVVDGDAAVVVAGVIVVVAAVAIVAVIAVVVVGVAVRRHSHYHIACIPMSVFVYVGYANNYISRSLCLTCTWAISNTLYSSTVV